MKSKLLINSQPLVLIPELAILIGLNEAIVLQQVHYWIQINRKTKQNYIDGHTWTYNSYTTWQGQFPFWPIITIKRTFTRLESKKLLISANYNKLKIDRTKWYRINYEKLDELAANSIPVRWYQNDPMHSIKMIPPLPEILRTRKTKPKKLVHIISTNINQPIFKKALI